MKVKIVKQSIFLIIYLITILTCCLNASEAEPKIKEPKPSVRPYSNYYRQEEPNPPKIKEPHPAPILPPSEHNIKEPKEPLKPREEFKPVIEEPKPEEPPEPPPPYIAKPHLKKPREPSPAYVPLIPEAN
ncbi:MAG: hypothetical protein SVN78_05310 [Deferribacterota bacterium]|nr:hypothetical protein [Deferribacterota bacterium]